MLECRVASVDEQTTVSSKAHNDAIRQLIAIGEERGSLLRVEIDALLPVDGAHDSLTKSDLMHEAGERVREGVQEQTADRRLSVSFADSWTLADAYRCSPVSCRITPNVAPGSVPAMNVSRIVPAAHGSVTSPVVGSTDMTTMFAGGTNRSAASRPSM